MSTAFTAETITDQKRYARGEQYRMAKALLQARDETHQSDWRVLMLAGPEPSGEIKAIRALMPRAVIIAVDKVTDYVARAKEAGADHVVICDLSQFTRPTSFTYGPCEMMKLLMTSVGKIDILHLDFCGIPNHEMKRMISVYGSCVSGKGVTIAAFSYGRDVEPMFSEARLMIERSEKPSTMAAASVLACLKEKGASAPLINRLAYLLQVAFILGIRSVIQYTGPQMPMGSVLFQKRYTYYKPRFEDVSFVKASAEEFNLCVTHPDVTTLYDCPEEKLRKIKASMAAQKAVATRRIKTGVVASNHSIFTANAGIVTT